MEPGFQIVSDRSKLSSAHGQPGLPPVSDSEGGVHPPIRIIWKTSQLGQKHLWCKLIHQPLMPRFKNTIDRPAFRGRGRNRTDVTRIMSPCGQANSHPHIRDVFQGATLTERPHTSQEVGQGLEPCEVFTPPALAGLSHRRLQTYQEPSWGLEPQWIEVYPSLHPLVLRGSVSASVASTRARLPAGRHGGRWRSRTPTRQDTLAFDTSCQPTQRHLPKTDARSSVGCDTSRSGGRGHTPVKEGLSTGDRSRTDDLHAFSTSAWCSA